MEKNMSRVKYAAEIKILQEPCLSQEKVTGTIIFGPAADLNER